MSVDREILFSTLFERVATIEGIVYASRIFKTWDDLDASQQPAIIMVKDRESTIPSKGMPNQWMLRGSLLVYVRYDDPKMVPMTALNNILTAIEKAFERQPNEARNPNASFPDTRDYNTNLGGLCDYCAIEGEIETDSGALGQQSVAIVPFLIASTS